MKNVLIALVFGIGFLGQAHALTMCSTWEEFTECHNGHYKCVWRGERLMTCERT